jgi:CspA family cold shock protein
MSDDNRATGVAKVVNSAKGFSFIKQDYHYGADVYAHFSEFELAGIPHPDIGDRFSFRIVESERGLRAVEIESFD